MSSSSLLSEKAKGKQSAIADSSFLINPEPPSSHPQLPTAETLSTPEAEPPLDRSGDAKDSNPFGLEILHEPKIPPKNPVQIVFVHGLGGSKRGTWTHANANFWPTWLHDEKGLENVRIMTFGYKSTFKVSPQTRTYRFRFSQINSCSAIIYASENPNFSSLAKDIKAVVFLGTPHRGADLAGILDLALTISFSRRSFVKHLNSNSEGIKAINNSFVHRANSLKLVSFFETENTRFKWVIHFKSLVLILQWIPAGAMVVPEFSATLEYPSEIRAGLNGNHITIAKYSSKRDENFVTVATTLHKLVTDIVHEHDEDTEPQPVMEEKALIYAARDGDIEKVKKLLGLNISTKIKDENGFTALHHAARWGHGDIVALLLDKKGQADAAETNQYGWTTLHRAAYGGHRDVVAMLLDKMDRVDVAAKSNRGGWTALHRAAYGGHRDVVALLLDKMGRADVRAKDYLTQRTALHYAAEGGHTDMVALLLDKMGQADAAAKTIDYGWTALHYSANGGHKDVVALLLDKMGQADIAAKDPDNRTALHLAAENGHTDVVALLLDKMGQADVAAETNQYGWTALHCAVDLGYKDVVVLLLDKMGQADVAAKTRDGWMALHFAARKGYKDVVAPFLDKMGQADVALKTKDYGWTALDCAANGGHDDVVALLERALEKRESRITGNGDAKEDHQL